jgi:hypothetical protein
MLALRRTRMRVLITSSSRRIASASSPSGRHSVRSMHVVQVGRSSWRATIPGRPSVTGTSARAQALRLEAVPPIST